MSAVERLTPGENTLLGILCGCIEVAIMQPVLYCKNATQQGLPIQMKPSLLYRGLGVSIVNMGVVTGMQFPLTGAASSVIKGGEDRGLSRKEQIVAGLIGGMVSGVVCSPMELIMIQQQRKGLSLFKTPSAVVSQGGLATLLRGAPMTSGREGLYTAGYLGIGPVLTSVFQDDYNFSPSASKAAGAISAGVVAATLSHPMDTIKTCMQGDIERKRFTTIPQTFQTLWAEGGAARFCQGWSWRTGRMIGAVFIIAETQSFFAPMMFPTKFA